jgi:hypothetical protein
LRAFGEQAAKLRAVADQHDRAAHVDLRPREGRVIGVQSVTRVDQRRPYVAVAGAGIERQTHVSGGCRRIAGFGRFGQIEPNRELGVLRFVGRASGWRDVFGRR